MYAKLANDNDETEREKGINKSKTKSPYTMLPMPLKIHKEI